jgi:glycosyltransferase involved in cell wall biosynthesis
LKIAWVSDWNRWGNGKGYTVHNTNMLKWAKAIGIDVRDTALEADVVLDVVVPTGYNPVPGKKNILFTMYEMDTLPEQWIAPINLADLIIVPCTHNKHLFQRYTDKPVEVCQEGIDPAIYNFHPRAFPADDEYFNFLWVGASNPRKGFELVCMAWEGWIKTQPQAIVDRTRMIMKSTKESKSDYEVGWLFNMIFDLRKLSEEKLVELYHGAHAFLLPSMGEGWALTLCEAQATGLPCIYTPWSGPNEFMRKEWSYPIRLKMSAMQAMRQNPETNKAEPYHTGYVALGDVDHILRRMEQIYYGYADALARGRRGAEHIARHYTWEKAAYRLAEIIEKHTSERLEIKERVA